MVSCFQTNKKKSFEKIKSNNSKSILGIWVSSNFENQDIKYRARDFFRPTSGFIISFDSVQKAYFIEVQYGEQRAKFQFDSISFFDKKIVGVRENNPTIIGEYDSDFRGIFFNLIDSTIYSTNSFQPRISNKYIHISECQVNCSVEQFALNHLLPDSVLNVQYKNKIIDIKFIRDTCSCESNILNIEGYKRYQILDIENDSEKKVIKLALSSLQYSRDDFFNIIIDHSQNTLIKN
jgi:hypothetical protein